MEYAAWSVVFGEQPTYVKWNILGENDAYFNDSLQTGWVNPDETWNYASATTFTVAGDQTAKYTRGVKIKLVQSATTKYFVVVTSVYGAPNTTVTVTDAQGGSVYTIANSTISDNRYSLAVKPSGWPSAATVLSYDTGDGWQDTGEDWSFNAADAPVYTITTTGDKTTKYYNGMRIKLTHSSSVKYFIVVKVAYSAPSTILTLYGGTDYTLSASTLSNVFYSREYAPAGFPLDPTKWTVSVTDTSSRSQANPAITTWYNLGTTNSQITIPIGAWDVYYEVMLYIAKGGTAGTVFVELSTNSAASTDPELSCANFIDPLNAGIAMSCFCRKDIVLTAKTLYYLVAMFNATSATSLQFVGASKYTKMRARSSYI